MADPARRGVGLPAPLAANGFAAGKAKNRLVELVRQWTSLSVLFS